MQQILHIPLGTKRFILIFTLDRNLLSIVYLTQQSRHVSPMENLPKNENASANDFDARTCLGR